jgi:hypothetical protein
MTVRCSIAIRTSELLTSALHKTLFQLHSPLDEDGIRQSMLGISYLLVSALSHKYLMPVSKNSLEVLMSFVKTPELNTTRHKIKHSAINAWHTLLSSVSTGLSGISIKSFSVMPTVSRSPCLQFLTLCKSDGLIDSVQLVKSLCAFSGDSKRPYILNRETRSNTSSALVRAWASYGTFSNATHERHAQPFLKCSQPLQDSRGDWQVL